MIKEIMAVVIVFLVFFLGVIWIGQTDLPGIPEGWRFCIDKGYDGTTFFGSYSEWLGKVECYRSYKNMTEVKEFDVTKKWGIIKDTNQGVSE